MALPLARNNSCHCSNSKIYEAGMVTKNPEMHWIMRLGSVSIFAENFFKIAAAIAYDIAIPNIANAPWRLFVNPNCIFGKKIVMIPIKPSIIANIFVRVTSSILNTRHKSKTQMG